MSMYYAKLRGRIKEICGTQATFAEKMNMSLTSVSAKVSGKSDWTQSEIQKACTVLAIKPKDLYLYFFAV